MIEQPTSRKRPPIRLAPSRTEMATTSSRDTAYLRLLPAGFTIIEVLVVMAILALLLAILVPTLHSVRAVSKTVVCSSNMKNITMEFRFFADGTSERGRGDSARLGPTRFWIGDFQDSLYRLDEFWNLGDAPTGTLDAAGEAMLCPAGAQRLFKRRGLPCGREAISPVEDVSIAVNMRLHRAVFDVRGKKLLVSPTGTNVSQRVLSHPYVPLVLDVDGRQAVANGVDPFYIAPPVATVDDPYATGRYWSPSDRHRGKTVVGFVGGHVLASEQPHNEKWDWLYQGEIGR